MANQNHTAIKPAKQPKKSKPDQEPAVPQNSLGENWSGFAPDSMAAKVESPVELPGRQNLAQKRSMFEHLAHLQGNRSVQRMAQKVAAQTGSPNQTTIQRENDREPLTRAELGDLFYLFVADPEQEEICLPSGEIYTMDWLLGPEGTAILRGYIQSRLNLVVDQPDMLPTLLSQVHILAGYEDRRTELSELVQDAFFRAESLGTARAQSSSPEMVAEGRQGRTWTPRGEARDETRDLSGRIHAAMDVNAPRGTGVFAPIEGEVIFSGRIAGYGNVVRLMHENPPPTEEAGEGAVSTNFAHLHQRLVEVGQRVAAGEAIGLVGTERAGPGGPEDVGGVVGEIGPHLHFSVQRVPEAGVERYSSRYEERTSIRVHPERWLNELGVAVTGSDDRALERYEQRRQRQAERAEQVQRSLAVPAPGGQHNPVHAPQGDTHPRIQRDIAASELESFGTPEQNEFMRRVYDLQRRRASRQRTFVADIPAEELAEVEGNVRLLAPAAEACRNLLAAARAALAEDQQRGDEVATQAQSIGVVSGYRSATTQLGEWRENFPNYYAETQEDRAGLAGGEHGEEAAALLARYIGGRLASPGYSLHNNAIAIDFKTRQGETELRARTNQIAQWEEAWFYRWLTAHAGEYQFAQNPGINEPWHWEFQGEIETSAE